MLALLKCMEQIVTLDIAKDEECVRAQFVLMCLMVCNSCCKLFSMTAQFFNDVDSICASAIQDGDEKFKLCHITVDFMLGRL